MLKQAMLYYMRCRYTFLLSAWQHLCPPDTELQTYSIDCETVKKYPWHWFAQSLWAPKASKHSSATQAGCNEHNSSMHPLELRIDSDFMK